MATTSNLKSAVIELRDVFAQHLPAGDVPAVLRKAVENALTEVLGDGPKRRGRPPKNATAMPAVAPAPKGRVRTAASLKSQAEKMRAYWKARKAAEATKGAPMRKSRTPASSSAMELPSEAT